MGLRLVLDSMPNVRQLAPPHLLPKVQSGKCVVDIAAELQITIEQTTKHVVELIKRGKLISLCNLRAFCGETDTCDPTEIYEKFTDEDLCATQPPKAIETIIDRIHNECPNASKIFIEVVLAYYQVRHHLKRKRKPYVDVVDDTLVLGELLIRAGTPTKPIGDSDHKAKPWRFQDIDTYYGNRVDDVNLMDSSSSEDGDSEVEDDDVEDSNRIETAANIDGSQYELADEEADSLWNNAEFDPTFRYRSSSESLDEGQQSGSGSCISVDCVVETDEEDMEIGQDHEFEFNGIIDDDDSNVESQERGNIGQTAPTSTSLKRESSFEISIGNEANELNDNDLCDAVMDTYEALFESPSKKLKMSHA